jgi:predicted GNAT family acetyltransferase
MNDPEAPINARTKKRIIPSQTWVIKEGVKIISTCNLQGASKNVFQIGGLITHPDHRGKGLAKKIISTLCRDYFKKGKKAGQLFVKIDNTPALAVYKKLGFKKTGDFIIAEF